MSNFRIYPGLWLTVVHPIRNLSIGERVQVLNAGSNFNAFITFVGKEGTFSFQEAGQCMGRATPALDDVREK